MKKILTLLSLLLCAVGFAQKVQEIKVEPVTIQLEVLHLGDAVPGRGRCHVRHAGRE